MGASSALRCCMIFFLKVCVTSSQGGGSTSNSHTTTYSGYPSCQEILCRQMGWNVTYVCAHHSLPRDTTWEEMSDWASALWLMGKGRGMSSRTLCV